VPDSGWNRGKKPNHQEPISLEVRERVCAFTARIEHAATLSIEDLHEAIRLYRELYREFCPEQEESALEAMIAILRKPLP
jgi:hypothetical protein